MFVYNYGTKEDLYVSSMNDVLLQSCTFITDIFTMQIIAPTEHHHSSKISLRMSENYFVLNTTKIATKIIFIQNNVPLSLNWMLWKSWFEIDSFHIESNDSNFVQNIDRFVTLDQPAPFPGFTSENAYASGKIDSGPTRC